MECVDFTQVGGLEEHILCIKEMIYPLMYQGIYERFHIKPPRGVLFYGPPGTGKTLMAKAIYNECSRYDRRITFFSRKGADCLSKWVGNSEKNLRSLFEQAQQKHPSIIFFDEIDGLAPTRSERQDHVHSSVVSTLLALMDGLNTLDDIIVIGATNRIEVIDPALRRPGRFERELYFPLPAFGARKDILHLHVDQWDENSRPSSEFIDELASNTVGYSGADLQALCCEAVMCGLRRKYPQICAADNRFRVNLNSFTVEKSDFIRAKSKIIPLASRTLQSPRKRLPRIIYPLLQYVLEKVLNDIRTCCPVQFINPDKKDYSSTDLFSNPRLILTGSPLQGQTTYLAPAILHNFDHLPVYMLDVTTLYENSTTEEACIQKMKEVYQNLPAILYTPDITAWWDIVDEATKIVFLDQINKIRHNIFLLATAHVSYASLSEPLQQLFNLYQHQVIDMKNPTRTDRYTFFHLLFSNKCVVPPHQQRKLNVSVSNLHPCTSLDESCNSRNREGKRIREVDTSQNIIRFSRRIRGLSAISLPDTVNYGASTSQSQFDSYEEQPCKKAKFEIKKEYNDINSSERDNVVINHTRLSELLEQALEVTEDSPICALETLYDQLIVCILRYQNKWDRSQLTNDMEIIIKSFKKEFIERTQDSVGLSHPIKHEPGTDI